MASRSSPRFSIIEVARKAGVSPATVSRAFNQPEIVHPDTLAHIRNVAKRAGFRPNRVGRSLRSGSTRTIGLILPTLSNPVFAECFEGAERRARESGYSVMLTATGYDPAVESAAVQGLMDHQVDGLILTVADAAKSATLDDRAAASDMVAHLAALGHRRIALVTGPLTASDRARRRLTGARACAKRLGLDDIQHISMSSHTGSDLDALKAALRGKQAPTALFCSNDLLATAVIADLVGLGLSVPADISVCGFDGMRFGALLTPPLTTVAQPSDGIGETACSNLLAQIQGQPPHSDRLPHCIVVGGTAAPVRR
jgi:DNA-binding LacI/PurR family transcriptional regulator